MKDVIKKLHIVAGGLTVIILWLAAMIWLLPHLIELNPFNISLTPTDLGIFFFGCILAPLWEEAAFRHAPLQIAKKLRESFNMDLTMPIILISSAIFGWGHGMGAISIMIQGIGGLILSYVYIKTNYTYWCSVLLHFLWNFSLLYVFPIFAGEYGIKIY